MFRRIHSTLQTSLPGYALIDQHPKAQDTVPAVTECRSWKPLNPAQQGHYTKLKTADHEQNLGCKE